MSESDRNKSLTKQAESKVPSKINLDPSTSLDISWLSEDERTALLSDYTKGMLDISRKAQELSVDASALKQTLDHLSDSTRGMSDSGNAVTMTHSQESKLGRTEIMMGNTEHAHRGRLSKSQSGDRDWTPFYILGGIVALIVIVALMNGQ